jgi:N6-L-threonylcarbamoyladenine synthase
MITLGIETSCDDTAIAIYDAAKKHMLYNKRHSQLDRHNQFGGIMPELASRDHQAHLLPLLDDALKTTQLNLKDLALIAYTRGPGLVGSLFVGASLAHGLSMALDIPLIDVHHHRAHIEITRLDHPEIQYPFIALLVSGGHTLLCLVTAINECEILGATIDDAIGETLDKCARVMGLPYPGGPEIERIAAKGNPTALRLPKPMINDPTLNMSFSGLKTALIRQHEQNAFSDAELAAALQQAIASVLEKKLLTALSNTQVNQVVFCGGVAANQFLGHHLATVCQSVGATCIVPKMAYCTDNGAMVAFTGAEMYLAGMRYSGHFVDPSWRLS